jgi:hypothetical protein
MSDINDGGPMAGGLVQTVPMGDAFAQVTTLQAVGGLSIRDWMAGMALQGILGYMKELGIAEQETGMERAEGAACMAYHYADAMIAARDRKEGA